MVPEYNDNELLDLFRKPESRNLAFSLIVRRFQERLYWHIRKMVISHEDADDLLQNTFLKAWRGLDDFQEQSQLYTWLYRIATNETLSFLKQKRTRFFLPIHDVEAQLSQQLETEEYFSGNETEIKLQQALLRLPEKQRLVFNMKYFGDMKYEEMSEILGTSIGALKASYHIAVKKLEKYLGGD